VLDKTPTPLYIIFLVHCTAAPVLTAVQFPSSAKKTGDPSYPFLASCQGTISFLHE
jgi:hypothetical protein